jgi:hypothetical protein
LEIGATKLKAMKIRGRLLLAMVVLMGLGELVLAQPVHTQALAVTGLRAEGNCFCNPAESFLGRKKKKKHKANFFAVGAVIGDPVGFGGRVIVRPSRLAVAGDIAYNRIRTDRGLLTHAIVLKTDARYYADGLLAKLLRPYVFVGATMQRGNFDETKVESVFAADAGVGAGIKLWRLELNAEVGLLLPVKQTEAYSPGVGAFANVGIMVWLL